jgi:hypothetical protein
MLFLFPRRHEDMYVDRCRRCCQKLMLLNNRVVVVGHQHQHTPPPPAHTDTHTHPRTHTHAHTQPPSLATTKPLSPSLPQIWFSPYKTHRPGASTLLSSASSSVNASSSSPVAAYAITAVTVNPSSPLALRSFTHRFGKYDCFTLLLCRRLLRLHC